MWEALSEFFLDDELTNADLQRIAGVLALSRYSEEEIHDILRFEVYPACSLNLVCVAGAWGTWGENWIRERIAPRYNRRPRFYMPALNWSGIRNHWESVKSLLGNIRSTKKHGEQVSGGNGEQAL